MVNDPLPWHTYSLYDYISKSVTWIKDSTWQCKIRHFSNYYQSQRPVWLTLVTLSLVPVQLFLLTDCLSACWDWSSSKYLSATNRCDIGLNQPTSPARPEQTNHNKSPLTVVPFIVGWGRIKACPHKGWFNQDGEVLSFYENERTFW